MRGRFSAPHPIPAMAVTVAKILHVAGGSLGRRPWAIHEFETIDDSDFAKIPPIADSGFARYITGKAVDRRDIAQSKIFADMKAMRNASQKKSARGTLDGSCSRHRWASHQKKRLIEQEHAKYVSLTLPPVSHGDEHADATNIKVKWATHLNQVSTRECVGLYGGYIGS